MPSTPFRFAEGDWVLVKYGPPDTHCRTPYYLRGKAGIVLTCVGAYRNPAQLAFHKPGLPLRPLYRVYFTAIDVWCQDDDSPNNSIVADLFEHWLDGMEDSRNEYE